jgi:ribose transport system substrate-binding protein
MLELCLSSVKIAIPVKKITPFFLVLFVLACGQGCDKNSNPAANNSSPKKWRLAFVTNTTNTFWATVRHGCDNAAQNLGNVALDFRFFTNSTVEAQEEVVSNLVAGGVDGIAISPIDAEKQTDFLNQIAAKTLLVCVDSDAANSKRACFIGSDNVTAGRQAADLLKAALPHGGKIVLCVGYPNAQNAKDRIQAIQDELAGSNIQIVDTLADEAKIDVAQKNALDAMAKYPDLAALVGLYSYNGPAILTAVRAAGKAGKVKIVCFDDDSATLDGVAAGDIDGTVVQISTRIGYETISRMDKYLGGDKAQLAEGRILFKTIVVNKGMAESFQIYRQNLIEP